MSDGWTGHGKWKSRVLDYDPELKRTTYYYVDEHEMRQRLVEHYDTSDIIEQNKAEYAATDERASWKGDMHHVGRIPISIAHEVLRKTGWGKDREAVSRWLRDPDNRFFLRRPLRFGL